MAKGRKVFKINDFSGGLNNNASTTNLEPNESVQLTNLKTDETGTLSSIRTAERAQTIYNNLPNERSSDSQSALQGKGIFGHGSDYSLEANGTAGLPNKDEFITYHPKPNNFIIDCHSRAGSITTPTWFDNKIIFTDWDGDEIEPQGSDKMVPAYYVHDGVVRVCDSDFSNDITTMYHGYVNHKLYKDSDGTPFQTIEKWSSGDARIQSLEDIGIDVNWVPTKLSNPVPAALKDIGTLTLGIKESKRVGSWNGEYRFGITPIYWNNQEGPISICQQKTYDLGTSADTNYAYYDKSAISIELFITVGTTTSTPTDNAHLLADERIVGLGVYVQKASSESWYRLFKCDLEHGEKKTGWKHGYTASVDANKGRVASGNLTPSFAASAGGTEHTLSVVVDLGTYEATMDDETFILVTQGFYQTPLYHTFTKSGSATQTESYKVVNPINTTGGAVEMNFKFTVLNQFYFPILQKTVGHSITDADVTPATLGGTQNDAIIEDIPDYEEQADD